MKCQNDVCALFVPKCGQQCQVRNGDEIVECGTRIMAEKRLDIDKCMGKKRKKTPFEQLKQEILLIKDVVEIAKCLQWNSLPGDEKAQTIMRQIYAGKYGSGEELWVQVENALERLEAIKEIRV